MGTVLQLASVTTERTNFIYSDQVSEASSELTLTDTAFRGAAHVKACITAAVLGLIHLGTARSPAKGWVVHDTPLRWRCMTGEGYEDLRSNGHRFSSGKTYVSVVSVVVLTCLGLVLTVRATPALGAGAFVLVKTFHAGTTILAGIACTLTYVFKYRRE